MNAQTELGTHGFNVIDGCGSFCTDDGLIDAICWTHRGGGWEVHDWRGDYQKAPLSSVYMHVRTKREAVKLVRSLAAA